MPGENILTVEGLTAGYFQDGESVRILRDLSFGVSRNQILGIAGESGCGKSTLASTLLNVINPPAFIEKGSVWFEGSDLLKMDEEDAMKLRATTLSYLPQAAMNSLNPILRIRDQFYDIMRAHQVDPLENMGMIHDSLDLANIERKVLDNYPHQLSGGMRQRVMLALAIVLSPEFLIVDEPTTGLDVIVQHNILKTIRKIQKEKSLTMLFITHDISLLYEISDSIMILYGGMISEYGEYSKLLNSPDHPYTYLLLNSTPSLRKKTKKLARIPGDVLSFKHYPAGCNFSPRCPFATSRCQEIAPERYPTRANYFHSCMRSAEWRTETEKVMS